MILRLAILSFTWCVFVPVQGANSDYVSVQKIFAEHCLDCHSAQDPDGKLVLESFETLLKGGESGAAIVPGKASDSLLVKLIEGAIEKDGKKKIMPPGKRIKLAPEQITAIRAWIDGGAKAPPPGQTIAKDLVLPKIEPKGKPRVSINAAAYSSSANLVAAAGFGEVALKSPETNQTVRALAGHRGNVNAIVFSKDGARIYAGAGETSLFGEIREWNVADGKLLRTLEGHRDAIYSLALSPNGKILASGSYDQKIILWDIETGKELRTLSGHNGAIFGLSFRADGKILASASADRTVKLWDVATGERRDTLSQSLKELHAVQFSPDGKRLVAGGVDNRIRVWEVSEKATETTNPILISKFAHEGAILRLAFSSDGKKLASSGDDKIVKIWEGAEFKTSRDLPTQSDWPTGLAFLANDQRLAVGRVDGTMDYYETATGKTAVPAKPELSRVHPRGLQSGGETRITLTGKQLAGGMIQFSDAAIKARIISEQSSDTALQAVVSVDKSLANGSYDAWIKTGSGDSAKLKVHVDHIPQFGVKGGEAILATNLPASFWGTHDQPGVAETFRFQAKAGTTLVFELAAKSLGSKSDALLTLTDKEGRVLATNSGFDSSGDPLIAHTFAVDGEYSLRVSELVLGASNDHFYKLSAGSFPFVAAVFPLGVPKGKETELKLIGYNLGDANKVSVKLEKAEPLKLSSREIRTRKPIQVEVTELPLTLEQEPNDMAAGATAFQAPAELAGQILGAKGSSDPDLFKFAAKAGQQWIVETLAAAAGSPLDSKIEILDSKGAPVQRLVLQAVRNSAINFRPITSVATEARVDNWEEMELNEFLYFQGEVTKLFRAPQGPDSAFVFYALGGKRRTYFDTSSTAHAIEELCYIVEPHPVGTTLVSNGLPSFPIYYANDDDAERKKGSDSKVHFTVPRDGDYLIRVTDTRANQGERYAYRLLVREPKPDFSVALGGANLTIGPGTGQSFTVTAERKDNFEDEIRVEISGLPPGFIASSPIIIQAGHTDARGTIFAAADAPSSAQTNTSMAKVVASARIGGKMISKDVSGLGALKLGPKPKLFVRMDATLPATTNLLSADDKPIELTIAPGETIPAWLAVQRNGHEELITFTVDNLPHGVIVDNIGLNGVLIPKGENQREIFLKAANWVPETDRYCFAIENQTGRQTSRPILLHVRKGGMTKTASVR